MAVQLASWLHEDWDNMSLILSPLPSVHCTDSSRRERKPRHVKALDLALEVVAHLFELEPCQPTSRGVPEAMRRAC